MKNILLVMALIIVVILGNQRAKNMKYWGCVNGALEVVAYKNISFTMDEAKEVFKYCKENQP